MERSQASAQGASYLRGGHCPPLSPGEGLHICDGSEKGIRHLLNVMQQAGRSSRCPKQELLAGAYGPRRCGIVESKTFIVTRLDGRPLPIPRRRAWSAGQLDVLRRPVEVPQEHPRLHGRTHHVVVPSTPLGPVGFPAVQDRRAGSDSPYVGGVDAHHDALGGRVLETFGRARSCAFIGGLPTTLTRQHWHNNWPRVVPPAQ